VTTDSASIRGVVNPEGAATTVYVEYGKTVTYGLKAAPKIVPAGFTSVDLLFHLSGLSQNTTYHYRVVATHVIDKKSGAGADKAFTTQAGMQVTQAARATTATSKGVVPVTLFCSGNVLRRCSGTLDANSDSVGSRSFSLMPNKRKVVSFKLKPKGLKLLMRKKRLRLDVTITAPDGIGNVNISTNPLTVVAPSPVRHRAVTRHK
jgi:hypothetical protein